MKNVVLLNFSMSSFEISYYFHVHIPHLRQCIRLQLFRILASKSTRKIPAIVSIIAIFDFTLTIYICMMIQFTKNCSPNLTICLIYNGDNIFSIFKFKSFQIACLAFLSPGLSAFHYQLKKAKQQSETAQLAISLIDDIHAT